MNRQAKMPGNGNGNSPAHDAAHASEDDLHRWREMIHSHGGDIADFVAPPPEPSTAYFHIKALLLRLSGWGWNLEECVQFAQACPRGFGAMGIWSREILTRMVKPEPKPGDGLPVTLFGNIEPSLVANDFVEDLLTTNSLVIVFGEPGCGKTFWMLDICLHVASGRRWQGRAVEQGAVIYLALEGGNGIRNRIAAARQHMKLPDTTPLVLIQCPVDLCHTDADTSKVVATIRLVAKQLDMPVRMVVVDTLSRAISGGDENTSQGMGGLVVNADWIRNETGVCVVFIHHSGKDAARGPRGHSSLSPAGETDIEISRTGERSSVAHVRRQRDLPSEGNYGFRLETVELGLNQRGKPVTSCVVVPADLATTRAKLNNNEDVSLRCLGEAMKADGAAQVGDWRSCFYRERPDADRKTQEKAFKRSVEGLLAKRCIGTRDGLYWPITGQ